LIVVLWLVALLTTMTASYHASARVESKLLAQDVHRAQAEALAEAGLWIVVRDHFESAAGAGTRSARVTRTVTFGDAEIEVALADATGWINLNAAQRELLESLLTRAEVPAAQASALASAILDWRDPDGAPSPDGAEDDDYARIGAAHGAKDAPFATVDELRQVRGMTDEIFRRIAPLLTVHGDAARVHLQAAPADVLRALPGADDQSVADVLRQRADPRGERLDQVGRFDRRFTQTRGSDIYVVRSIARAGGATARIAATVRYARSATEPLQVLDWEPRDG
jgi:general secretion pathway protein K